MDSKKELTEAISAADVALEHLHAAADRLSSAKSWGWFDIFAGGFISTFIKHQRMDEAEDEMRAAKQALLAFKRELQDVDKNISLDFNTTDFLTFADYLFDGWIADAFMQSRISDARQKLNDAIDQVTHIRSQLLKQLKRLS